jgi:hypothetical protein
METVKSENSESYVGGEIGRAPNSGRRGSPSL